VLSWLPAVALVAAAVAVAARWYPRRRDSLGRRRPFPLVTVTLLALLAAAAATPGVLRVRQERRLAGAASALAGVPVAVRCQTFGGAFVDSGPELGYVRWRTDGTPERWTLIKREQCRDLAAYVRAGGRRPSGAQMVAVHVLTHEAMHLAGITDEARAECAAVQRDARTARLLGASAAEAHRLAAWYWRTVYPTMPGGYRSPECRAGGALDERLPHAPWAAQPAAGASAATASRGSPPSGSSASTGVVTPAST
jgi:hypothetical protein